MVQIFSDDYKRHVTHSFSDFAPLSTGDIVALIKKSPTKSCVLDPFPTKVLKRCLEEVSESITLL